MSLPVSFCYALAVTSIPIVSRLKKEGGNYYAKIIDAVKLTALLSFTFAILTYAFSGFAVNILYSRLTSADKLIATNMLKLSSASVIFLPIMQTLIACVNALGKYKITIVSGIISALFKIGLSSILLKIVSFNVFGAIISDIFCYLVACFVNISYIIYSKVTSRLKYEQNNRYRLRS